MLDFIRSEQRGSARFGWLNSRHSFSFGHYYNAEQMGFSALRVINDDHVTAGAGFDTHGHRNMEIISYVLGGEMVHKDSAGNEKVLPAGEFQLMSAGSGIRHSEFNASDTEPLSFLQIWIEPDQLNTKPGYQQRDFGRQPGQTLIASADGRDNSLLLKQDASLSQLLLGQGDELILPLLSSRCYYLHVISGQLYLNGEHMNAGDGVKISMLQQLAISVPSAAQALWFDLPALKK